ncbi:MAG: VOC family protein [Sciscionella sp.]|nr:VOC family protein [Sciscionella sp.]
MAKTGIVHHVEIWVPDLRRAIESWGWLLPELGYSLFQQWPAGRSWRLGDTYLVFEQSPALTGKRHDRLAPGLNHLAFHVEDRARVDDLTGRATNHGWTVLFADRHPFAGGDQHYASYLENTDGFEIELVSAE